ncbi:hypothetical protein DFH08DRAFT_870769 [Mycena albidolilacea]|uniref:Uncharacterized protein n=1 Tax=Mycena albidolilacea TaxID=1033008 RepID=A0AAD7ER15_9AGAR|nr:hypothetical protein DFH08DRAFT_870769 [Mycena albidolilacea]
MQHNASRKANAAGNTPALPMLTNAAEQLTQVAQAMAQKLNAEVAFLSDDAKEIEQCTALVTSTFLEREPLTTALLAGGVSAELNPSLHAFSKVVVEEAAKGGLTVVVKVHDEVKAVCIVTPYESVHGPSEALPGLEPVFDVLDRLGIAYDKHCAASGGKVRMDKTIDLPLAATAQDFQGKNAAEMAMFLGVMKAKAQGFTHCIAKATSNSAAVLAKNGFELLAEVDYKMYTFQGMKPFEKIPNFKSAKLMYRSLANFDAPGLKTRTVPKL